MMIPLYLFQEESIKKKQKTRVEEEEVICLILRTLALLVFLLALVAGRERLMEEVDSFLYYIFGRRCWGALLVTPPNVKWEIIQKTQG